MTALVNGFLCVKGLNKIGWNAEYGDIAYFATLTMVAFVLIPRGPRRFGTLRLAILRCTLPCLYHTFELNRHAHTMLAPSMLKYVVLVCSAPKNTNSIVYHLTLISY